MRYKPIQIIWLRRQGLQNIYELFTAGDTHEILLVTKFREQEQTRVSKFSDFSTDSVVSENLFP